jgi:hypothetical protein
MHVVDLWMGVACMLHACACANESQLLQGLVAGPDRLRQAW